MPRIREALVQNIAAVAAFIIFLNAPLLFAHSAPQNAVGNGPAQEDIVYELGNGVTPPRPISTPNPEYTDKARKKKINGTVSVRMVVTADGKVRDLKVIKSLEPGLDQQALAAVKTWTFDPATKDGKAVAVNLSADVTFRLY